MPQQTVKRIASITGLKPDNAAYYKELRAHPWPEVNQMIKDCNISNYSIHEITIEGKLFLFSYFEYTGTDYDADMKKMASDPMTQKSWQETAPCQTALPGAAADGKIWTEASEVFFLP